MPRIFVTAAMLTTHGTSNAALFIHSFIHSFICLFVCLLARLVEQRRPPTALIACAWQPRRRPIICGAEQPPIDKLCGQCYGRVESVSTSGGPTCETRPELSLRTGLGIGREACRANHLDVSAEVQPSALVRWPTISLIRQRRDKAAARRGMKSGGDDTAQP